MLHALLKFDSLCYFVLISRGNSERICQMLQTCYWRNFQGCTSVAEHPSSEGSCPSLGLLGTAGLSFLSRYILRVYNLPCLPPYGNHCRNNFFVTSLQRLKLLHWTMELKVSRSLAIIPCDRLLKMQAFPQCL